MKSQFIPPLTHEKVVAVGLVVFLMCIFPPIMSSYSGVFQGWSAFNDIPYRCSVHWVVLILQILSIGSVMVLHNLYKLHLSGKPTQALKQLCSSSTGKLYTFATGALILMILFPPVAYSSGRFRGFEFLFGFSSYWHIDLGRLALELLALGAAVFTLKRLIKTSQHPTQEERS